MRLQIELECPICQKPYYKTKSEYERNQKKGRESFCSISCAAKDSFHRKIPVERRSNYDISKHANNQRDEYSDFKYYFKILKIRMKKECDISLQDIKDVWIKQNGICPYTGIQLKLLNHTHKWSDLTDNRFEIASLDRIDSSKGYIKGNICFVSTLINFMKNNLTVESTVDFMRIIHSYLSIKTNEEIINSVNTFTNDKTIK